jgi:hypothetical protein
VGAVGGTGDGGGGMCVGRTRPWLRGSFEATPRAVEVRSSIGAVRGRCPLAYQWQLDRELFE